MKNFIEEFKEFAFKGNVLDLAVGVVIGAAFTAIVTSLVEDIIMPLVGIIAGGTDVSSLSLEIGTTTLAYGAFLQAVINFLLIAFVVFMFIKLINSAAAKFKKETGEIGEEVEIPAAEEYLKEIRDLLAKEQASSSIEE
ncbi:MULTISPECIES: large conductance mechanosensitive channel protein MscL [Carnobacterium]|uniref:Large-conductance mechanosensitive channel n=1 Tax=Carnobacterium antarcticum TaxID=2126436 RepID=A0ABW4NNV0_9LACT|nr:MULTISPECIES: large conductance mechanosensitive channel protein MscL [unclassified Carnobacterium]ALV22515.1 Large-conductance mechanosensitive channel [Carnobacterium sp. CP1]QQP70433.1 large conductance mechanosensitive channel protein MscL [Carnobacterium sp. CS13]